MYLFENPVLQRELLVNLRTRRAFVLLFGYNALLGLVVFFAWPQQQQLDLSSQPVAAKRLVDMFFLGQFILASMMAPSFAAGAISGEKERKTYEMLLANPLQPGAILLGKLLASLCHLAILIFASLPIVMLCLPLGGVHPSEVLAAYLALFLAVVTFGMISLACSSYFRRTSSALMASYLLILPLALMGILFWTALSAEGTVRFWLSMTVLPAVSLTICGVLFTLSSARLLHPPDVGSEGKEVVDLATETKEAVGMIIQPDQFPDKLFAPAKRDDLMADGTNPIYDKEIRSEVFSQGTLMLRLVIQISTFLALPMMAYCLYINAVHAPWYFGYVILFNVLVGPVFSAGSITSERERETLELLLTTTITPWQILWGKLLSGLRISGWLTRFLLWPVALACVMNPFFWWNLPAVFAYLVVIELAGLTTAIIAMFCSVVFRKTSISLMTSYMVVVVLFAAPVAMLMFANLFFSDSPQTVERIRWLGVVSPVSAVFEIPLVVKDDGPAFESESSNTRERPKNLTRTTAKTAGWSLFWSHIAFGVVLNMLLVGNMIWLFNVRWRVSQ